MFPSALYPPACFPRPVFPGAGKGSGGSSPSVGLVGIFGGGCFPSSLFPRSVFPGTNFVPNASGPLVIDNEVANWLADTLDVEVFPMAIPQGTTDYPVMVYTVVEGDSYYRLKGQSNLAWVTYQLDCYSNLYYAAAYLAEQLRLALVALTRRLNDAGTSGVQIGAATIRNVVVHRPVSGYDPTGTGEDNKGMYRRMSEVTFYFNQDVSALG